MVKYIFIKSPDEWATTKQACRDKRVVRLNLFLYLILRSTHMYCALFYIYIKTLRVKKSMKKIPEGVLFDRPADSFALFFGWI